MPSIRNPYFPALANTWQGPQAFNNAVSHTAKVRIVDNVPIYWTSADGGDVYAFKGPDDYATYGNLIFDDGINVTQQTNLGLPEVNSSYPGIIFRYDLRSGNPSNIPSLSTSGQWYILMQNAGSGEQISGVFGVDGSGNVGTRYARLGSQPKSLSPTIASGTIYQNTTYSYQTLTLPFYASTAGTAGSVTINMGTSSSPGTWTTVYVSGSTSSTACTNYTLRVPPQWYYEVVVSGATIGTVNGIQE